VPGCVVIGAGPAGLTAAHELAKQGVTSLVLEGDGMVGGLSRTGRYRGYGFDIGGHRFFTKVPYVRELWEEILGEEFLLRPRLSRIYHRGRFFDYPLKPANALIGLGPFEALRIGASWLRAQLLPHREERTFEEWVSNRFGRRLFEIFFKTYTEKVWGMSCGEISADWARQRIKNLDLAAALRSAFLSSARRGTITSLIEEFHYPRLGPGQMWEACADRLAERGTKIVTGARVTGIRHEGGRAVALRVREGETEYTIQAEHVISSMPVRELVRCLEPAPPPEVVAAAGRLRYRDFLTVGLIVARDEVFPDNWIYIHSEEVRVGRIQNYKNWSPEMVPERGRTSLGLEYFVNEGDDLWSMSDPDLIALGSRECERLGLLSAGEVVDGTVIRMRKAYPVYDASYGDAMATIRSWLAGIPNLQAIGRNGQHRYNNQDHSMLTGVYAARNVLGASYDVWDVNVEPDYHEEARPGGDRLVPRPLADAPTEEWILEAFGRYDPVALGVALGAVLGLGLFFATAVLLLLGGQSVGPNLAVLRSYFPGFEVTWGGALLGLLEAGSGGFGLGWSLAGLINLVVAREERVLLDRIEAVRAMDLLESGPA
jgi:protoporphyrinogen oxidase